MKFLQWFQPVLVWLSSAIVYTACSVSGWSQLNSTIYRSGINVSWLPGFVITHNLPVENLRAHTQAVEISLLTRCIGSKGWQRAWHSPVIGYSLMYLTAGKNYPTGDALALTAHCNLWLLRTSKFSMQMRLGTGPGYNAKPFDRNNNFKNKAVASRLNVVMQVWATMRAKISTNLYFLTGAGITHWSNGSFSEPNYGLNVAHAVMGFDYYFFQKADLADFVGKKLPDYQRNPKHQFQISIGPGTKEYFSPNQHRRFWTLAISSSYLRRIGQSGQISGGIDFFYDKMHLYIPSEDSIKTVSNPFKVINIGIRSGYEIQVGKISLPLYIGVYVLNNNPVNGFYYQRAGVQYQFNKHWIAAVLVRLHGSRADNIEWTVGRRW